MPILRIFYYLIALLCLAISVVLSYYGYLFHFGNLTIPFVAVIGLFLLGGDIALQMFREQGKPLLPAFVVLFVGILASSLSNFNHLYSLFMKNDVVAETLNSQYQVFSDDMVKTSAALQLLDEIKTLESRRAKIDTELQLMSNQMLDPNRKGCAERCRAHMDNIQAILGTQLTDLKVPRIGSSDAELRRFHQTYANLVSDSLQNIERATNVLPAQILIEDIKGELDRYTSADLDRAKGKGLEMLARMSEASLDVERRANSILPVTNRVDHTPIDPGQGRLGQIPYTLNNAFVEMPNAFATFMSLIAALMIDLFPVIFALALFRKNEFGGGNDEDVSIDSPLRRVL